MSRGAPRGLGAIAGGENGRNVDVPAAAGLHERADHVADHVVEEPSPDHFDSDHLGRERPGRRQGPF